MRNERIISMLVTAVLILAGVVSGCGADETKTQTRATLVVKEPAEMADDSAVYLSDTDGNPHYAFMRKQQDKLLLIHDGKDVGLFDSAYDSAPTLSRDGKHVACWGVRADKVVLIEDGQQLVALEKEDVGGTDILPKADGSFVFKYQMKTGESIRHGSYGYYLFQTFVLFGKQKLGPFGRASLWCPETGNDFLLFATKSRGAAGKQLEQGITEWVVFRNGTEVRRWSTEEPLAVPLGVLATSTSAGNHYLLALRLSKQKWVLVLDGKEIATFDGAMVGDPSLCVESTGTNRIVTDTLALAEDGSHWVYGVIAEGNFQVMLDGKPVTSLTGWCPVTSPSLASNGRLGPFLAVSVSEKENTGLVDAYSDEWKYKWGAYTGKESVVVGETPQESKYGDLKHLVVSDDCENYAYAALKGEVTGTTLSRSGFSPNFQGTWHIVSDGKEGPPWADVRGLCFAPGKSNLAAMVQTVEDKTSGTKDGVSVLLDATQVASYEWAWSLKRKKSTVVWFSRIGSEIYINRLVNR